MKKLALSIALISFTHAATAVHIYEPFKLKAGTVLAGQNGWFLVSGTSPTVATNGLATPGLQPTSDGNSLLFGGDAMEIHHGLKNLLGGEQSGPYWYSLAFTVLDLGQLDTAGGYIAAFSATNPPGLYGGKLYLRKDAVTPNSYNIGVSKASDIATDIAWSTTAFQPGQTNFVVCSYHTGGPQDTDTLLWINPDPSTYGAANAPTPPDLTSSTGDNLLPGVGQFVLRQGSTTQGPAAILVDTIRVEGGWPHVTPIPLTMSVMLTNNTDVYLSWGGYQNVMLQQATSLTPPITWSNLNGGALSDGSIRNFTISNAVTDPFPKFFRLVDWYVE
jgi:hypothetical protein